MSMFHELMMRKKEQIMYATIKGTLTENNGVFSRFAYNNYLATQEAFDCSKDFEITTKVNTGNQSVTQFKTLCRNTFGANASTSIGFAIGVENGKIKAFFRDSNGTGLGSGTGNNGITTFANNVDCFFRFSQKKYNNTYTIQIESSLDNVNWVKEVNLTSSLPLGNSGQGIAFGGGSFSNTSQYWAGSIDLPNSYIKLGSTKYNLQAVVGYTIVGSPTIVDGVVSGFSSSDYLRLLGFNINSDYEIGTKIIVNNLESANRNIIGSQYVYSKYGFMISTNNKPYSAIWYELNGTYAYITSLIDLVLQPNTIYYLKAILKNNTYQAFLSTDKINWIEGNIANVPEGATIVSPNTLRNQAGRLTFGGGTQYTTFDGSIYLNETYIKLDNKLWFNGQQA